MLALELASPVRRSEAFPPSVSVGNGEIDGESDDESAGESDGEREGLSENVAWSVSGCS